MGDRDSKKIFDPHRRKKTTPRRSIRSSVTESENARVCESVDDDDDGGGDGLGIDVQETEGIDEKTFSREKGVNLGGIDAKVKLRVDLDLNFPVQDDEFGIEVKEGEGIDEKTFSWENDVNLGGIDVKAKSEVHLDLNFPVQDDEFDDRDVFDYQGYSVRRYTREEKGKGKVVNDRNRSSMSRDEIDGGFDLNSKTHEIDINVDRNDCGREVRRYNEEEEEEEEEEERKGNMFDNWLSIGSNAVDWEMDTYDDDEFYNLRLLSEVREMALRNDERVDLENRKRKALSDVRIRARGRRKDKKRIIESGAEFARANDKTLIQSSNNKNEISFIEGDNELDTTSPFSIAFKKIKERNSKLNDQEKALLIKWMPSRKKDQDAFKTHVPSLLDLSIDELAKNADAIASLEPAPDALKHKLSRAVCDSRRMNGQFLKLLMTGSPTEVRVRNCSLVTEEELSEIFQDCDTKNLRVLQLDLCGRCLPDYILSDTLARSLSPFPALATISLRGAGSLSDIGLKTLTLLAPSLQSINLGQCSLLTSASINTLANCFGSILKELYIDYCPEIDALQSLPALKKFEHLEVLSVAGIPTVSDAFITEFISARGQNLKELVLADCENLTDISLKIIGNSCNKLCVADLSKLHRLTDSGIYYLANGCRSIRVLKLSGIGFSDEAIAAVLEVYGSCLEELSLNYVSKVGPHTALSISNYSRSLLSLDLSWCRKLTDEALGLIVDSCLSLRLLKLFGCSQITEVFLNGHSNSSVRIIGLKHLPVLKHLDVLESQENPLRYSQLIDTDVTKPQSPNPSDV